MHSNVLPGTAGIGAGQVTVEWRRRFARIVCSIDIATLAVSTLAFAPPPLSPDFEEPQAAMSAAAASAVMTTRIPRTRGMPRVLLKAGGSICMRAYYSLGITAVAAGAARSGSGDRLRPGAAARV